MKFAAVFLLLIATRVWATAAEPMQTMKPEDFWNLPEVNQRIEIATFNRELMAAAIFHETNRTRQLLGLKKFEYQRQLDRAAESQASVGALLNVVSHDNPLPDLKTLKDRVARAGLDARIAAENIAATTILDGPVGLRTVHVKRINGREALLDPESGEELLPRTYADMAKAVVLQWMNSPPHRENIVNAELQYLGASAMPRKNASNMDSLYSVQVFFTPRAQAAKVSEKRGPRTRDSILKKDSYAPSTDRVPPR